MPIVKVQMPLAGAALILIYDQKKEIVMHTHPSKVLVAKMNGRDKAFFNASVIDGTLDLGDEAPDQPW